MYVIIVGCGSLGGHLANDLSRGGQDVVVIDNSPESFQELSAEFSGFKILADATEAEILQSARIVDADAVIACTQNDSVNLMIAQVAKKLYNVEIVIARVYNPARQGLYDDLGIDTICPTVLSAIKFKDVILARSGERG